PERLRADLADHVPRAIVEQARVDLAEREEVPDELLVAAAQQIGLGVRHAREAAPERLPQVARAVGLERRQELGEQLVAESVAPARDVREARVGDEAPEPLRRAAL